MERVLAGIHLHVGWHETGRPAEAYRVLGRVGIGAVHTPRGEDAELARPHHHMDCLLLVWLPVGIELQFVVIVAIEAGLLSGLDHLLIEIFGFKLYVPFFIEKPRPMSSRHDFEAAIFLGLFGHRDPSCKLPRPALVIFFQLLFRGWKQLFRSLKFDEAFRLVPVRTFVSRVLGKPLRTPAQHVRSKDAGNTMGYLWMVNDLI